MFPTRLFWLVAACVGFVAPRVVADGVEIEYLAHASFLVRSPGGVSVVIDPYDGRRWLGYDFPTDVRADGVLVTHPHYDHDASYYFPESTPVFRTPGRYALGDVVLVGIEGRHAGEYGRDFGQVNTIWLVETGGLRVAHLGDNGPLTESAVRALGRVDVLMAPADGLDHILTSAELDALRVALRPAIVIPMHYRLEGYRGLPDSLGPIEPWLSRQSNVIRVGSHRAELAAPLEAEPRVLVLEPSPSVRPWPEPLAAAWRKLETARDVLRSAPDAPVKAAGLVREAYDLDPGIVFAFQWARALHQTGRDDDAVAILERALAGAEREDREFRMRARSLLGELYDRAGRKREATEQHRIVLQSSWRTELLDKARAYLDALGK